MLTKPAYSPRLLSVKEVEEADYNPRERVPERMEFLRLSLVKLGFLLPLYTTPTGHLLSGHQRLHTSRTLGCVRVPVAQVDLSEEQLKTFNLVFNRATNDMKPDDTGENMFERLQAADMDRILDGLPDRDPLSDGFFRAMTPEYVPTESLIDRLNMEYDFSAVQMARSLLKAGILMPAVCVRDGTLINGNYRVLAAIDLMREGWGKLDHYPVVWIEPHEEEAARLLVNLVSMKFTVEKQHADVLRYGSFRRAELVSKNLTRAHRFWADRCRALSASDSLAEPQKFWGRWRAEHGATVLDFGAGQRRNTPIFRQKGIDSVDFEPYCVPWDQQDDEDKSVPSLQLSRRVTDEFLMRLDDGTHFDSVFMNAVLNSVPFHADRVKVMTIAHACCSFSTTLYGTTRHVATMNPRKMKPFFTESGAPMGGTGAFQVPFEPNVMLADIGKNPKLQKFMTPEEVRKFLAIWFKKVEVWDNVSGYIAFRCSAPKRVNPGALARAIDFEFNLPYPNDQTLDRHRQAREVFARRLGIEFPPSEDAEREAA